MNETLFAIENAIEIAKEKGFKFVIEDLENAKNKVSARNKIWERNTADSVSEENRQCYVVL